MDPITDLFQTMQIVGVVHARLEATAPWGLKREAEVSEGISKDEHSAEAAISPLHFAHFGMLSRGSCWLSVEGIPDPIPLPEEIASCLRPEAHTRCGTIRAPAHAVSAKSHREIVAR